MLGFFAMIVGSRACLQAVGNHCEPVGNDRGPVALLLRNDCEPNQARVCKPVSYRLQAATGNYALGILLKERHDAPRSQVSFDEFAVKMRSALEVLRLFNRPVALAVSSSIRFNLNNFHDHGIVTATELETGLQFFRSITSGPTAGESSRPTAVPALQKSSKRAICPVDRVSHLLLCACARLSRGGTISLAELETLRQHTRGMVPISEQDLAKIHVICAEGYIRLACAADARWHLQAIQFDPSFKDWAQRQLEDMSSHGN